MKYAVALSGGVDSTMAAYLIQESGSEVLGVTMLLDAKDGSAKKKENDTLRQARLVAEELGIAHHVLDLSGGFDEMVKKYFICEYSNGRTPNPCVVCNSRIKFGLLLSKALELGCDKIVTGHFARIIENGGSLHLAEGLDKKYDQSYFLCRVDADLFSYVDFPLGDKTKKWVQRRASKLGFSSAGRSSSQDICFLGEDQDYRTFLKKNDAGRFSHGNIVNTSGSVVGTHKGASSYTIGQRRGLGLSRPSARYVIGIDTHNNLLTVGTRNDAMKKIIRVDNVKMFSKVNKSRSFVSFVKIRYNSSPKKAQIKFENDSLALIEFFEPQFAPAPGQAAVFYDKELVIGSGWIKEALD